MASSTQLRPIHEIAQKCGIDNEYLIPHGKYVAKVDLSIIAESKNKPKGKLVLVTAITPTPLGEGKTVNTI